MTMQPMTTSNELRDAIMVRRAHRLYNIIDMCQLMFLYVFMLKLNSTVSIVLPYPVDSYRLVDRSTRQNLANLALKISDLSGFKNIQSPKKGSEIC